MIGDRRKHLAALIGIEADTVGDWATRQGLAYTTYGDLARKPEVGALVPEWVDARQHRARPGRGDQEVRPPARRSSTTEDGELTATQKVKRSAIEKSFTDELERPLRVTEFLQLCFAGTGHSARATRWWRSAS